MNDRDKGRGKEGRATLKIITYIGFALLCRSSGIKFALKSLNAKVTKTPFSTLSEWGGDGEAARMSSFQKITEKE